ncbi:serine/threonine-protein kinase [Amorphus orientalis]|uniref:Serine/threonine protein kinase n=1 Tax=Amorphus orientalis TaxID=649198 RepID=A0AAE3VLS9_9HYPH|nr:serine/threonine-protein kinase [Amorphus orientalis]MDQ0314302.1 serine/threonine protein kinase [Amorphus orientalis]
MSEGTTQRKPLPVPLGTKLRDRYELISVLGRGGMSTVYSALDHFRLRAASQTPLVAIKLLNNDPTINADIRELMHREARRMQEFVHPAIARVYDWDEDGGRSFIIMEQLEGQTLNRMLRKRGNDPVSRVTRERIVTDIGAALDYAHERGVVHTDVKPGNIFVTTDGAAKLLDFGISYAHEAVDLSEDDDRPTIAYFGHVGALTPAYASLEMLLGMVPAPSDDVYSLAVVAYMLTTGRHPYDHNSVRWAISRGLEPERPARGLTTRQWRALRQALAFERRDRTPEVHEFVEGFTTSSWLSRLLG